MGHKGRSVFTYWQSPQDVPCRITGEALTEPVFSLQKWEEAGLRFRSEFAGERVHQIREIPGLTVLTTGKRQHVYRRLDEGHFEYDIILPEYPGTCMFKIPLECPRGISFYKQGKKYGHLMRPNALGSYAVYWKRKNNQYRTGKFCHIYRPKIIDATGRWIWGDLDWDGEALWITVDESWLKRARYPVTVDPVIGTQSAGVGAYDFVNNEAGMPYFESIITANSYYLDTDLTGPCSAHYHSWKNDGDAGGYGVIYDDTGKRIPQNLVSTGAPHFSLSTGWSGTTFTVPNVIPTGDIIWFGLCAEWLNYPSFDEVGGELLKEHYLDDPTSGPVPTFRQDGMYWDILLSQYFTYENTTTFNVKIIGRIKPDEELFKTAEYKPLLEETADVVSSSGSAKGILRLISHSCSLAESFVKRNIFAPVLSSVCQTEDILNRSISFFRNLLGTTARMEEVSRQSLSYLRRLTAGTARTEEASRRSVSYLKQLTNMTVPLEDRFKQSLSYRRRFTTVSVQTEDRFNRSVSYQRMMAASLAVWDWFSRFWGRSCEEVQLYSRITLVLEMESKI